MEIKHVDQAFFAKQQAKIFKNITLKNGKRYDNVRMELHKSEERAGAGVPELEAIIFNSDAQTTAKLFIKRVAIAEIAAVELYDDERELIELFATFDLKPPSHFIELLIDELSSLKRRHRFDDRLIHLLGEKEVKRLAAALWMIYDPEVKQRVAWHADKITI